MAYQKTVWKDQDVENPRTYVIRDNGDDTVTLLDAFGTVTELGTPVNAANMNKIENGIADIDANYVTKNTAQTITQEKTFNVSPQVPTPTAGDSSTNAANTRFVQTAVNSAVVYVLSSLYPVGSLYITTQNTGSCPLASIISGSQWELVATDRALWGGNGWNAHSWINAGLPNITGVFGTRCLMHDYGGQVEQGALYRAYTGTQIQAAAGTDWEGANQAFGFDASRSNSIYGSSSTVQPPAYRVNVWRRIA